MSYTKPIESAPLCETCQTPMNLIPAGESKTKVNADGSPKKYKAFWSCPNNRECGGKTKTYTDISAVKEPVKTSEGALMVMDKLEAINKKLDSILNELGH